MNKFYFKKVKEKSKDPDNYDFKVLLSVIYEVLIDKGIVTKQELDNLVKEVEVEVEDKIKEKV